MSSILEAQEKKRQEEITGRATPKRRMRRESSSRKIPKWIWAVILVVSLLIVFTVSWVAYNAGKNNTPPPDSDILSDVRAIIRQEMINNESQNPSSGNIAVPAAIEPTVTPTNTVQPTATPTETLTPTPRVSDTPTVIPSVETLPGLQVQGIIWGVTRVVAIVNDNLLEVNDRIGDYRVAEIERQSIVLESSSGERVRLNR